MGRYSNIRKRKNEEGKQFYSTVRYPQVKLSDQDLYVITTEGDRYDVLANQYYKDPSLWWAISIANAGTNQSSYFPPVGVQIRIPSNITGIITNFEKANA